MSVVRRKKKSVLFLSKEQSPYSISMSEQVTNVVVMGRCGAGKTNYISLAACYFNAGYNPAVRLAQGARCPLMMNRLNRSEKTLKSGSWLLKTGAMEKWRFKLFRRSFLGQLLNIGYKGAQTFWGWESSDICLHDFPGENFEDLVSGSSTHAEEFQKVCAETNRYLLFLDAEQLTDGASIAVNQESLVKFGEQISNRQNRENRDFRMAMVISKADRLQDDPMFSEPSGGVSREKLWKYLIGTYPALYHFLCDGYSFNIFPVSCVTRRDFRQIDVNKGVCANERWNLREAMQDQLDPLYWLFA